MVNHPNRNKRPRLTAENLVPQLKGMRKFLNGIGHKYLETFEQDVVQHLSEEQSEKACTVLRDTLMLCTVLHDRLDIPSEVGIDTILGFAPKPALYNDLLWAVDPQKLDGATRNALTYDAHRLELTELPPWLQHAVNSMFPDDVQLSDIEPVEPPRYDLEEFANDLAEGLSEDAPDAIALPYEDAWIVRWTSGRSYFYVLTNAAHMGQPDRVNIRLEHPAFDKAIADHAQITVRHDRPIEDIVHDIDRRLIRRVPELSSKSDRIRWNKGLYPKEIEHNDYRRDRLLRIWGAMNSFPYEHPLSFYDVMVPFESGPVSRVCSFEEMKIDINDFSDSQVGYLLGYLTSRLDVLEEEGAFDTLFESTDTESWPTLIDVLTDYKFHIEEQSVLPEEMEEE